jgi:HlyD family secretion protein
VVTYTTIINAPNDDQKLKPGMTANVTIYTKEVSNALLISAKALKFEPDSSLAKKYTIVAGNTEGHKRHQHRGGGDSVTGSRQLQKGDTSSTRVRDSSRVEASEVAHVWVLMDSTRLVQKKIRTGLNNDTQVQVLDGLTASDVVVTGIERVTTGKGSPAAKSPFMPARPNRRPGGRGVR